MTRDAFTSDFASWDGNAKFSHENFHFRSIGTNPGKYFVKVLGWARNLKEPNNSIYNKVSMFKNRPKQLGCVLFIYEMLRFVKC